MANCIHFDQLQEILIGKDVCEECVKTGDDWVHLRVCQNCGITLCCDSSTNKHARAHFENEGHKIIASAEKSERWIWCYEDENYKKY